MATDSLEGKGTVLVTFSIAMIYTMMKKTYKSLHLGLQFQKDNSPSWQKAWQQVADMTAGAEGLTS